MSKLEELIAQLCPNGVEYKRLSEVTTIERGKRVVKEQLSHDSGYPVFQNSLTPMGFHTDSNYPAETTYVIGAGAAGEIGYCKENFWAADDCFPIVCGDSVINRYVYHFLLWQQPVLLSKVRKASIPRLSRSVIENLMITVPPLPVQEEIVRILDNFTELTVELTVELTAELTARKKQYEAYRDKLFDVECETVPITTIAHTYIGLVTTMTKHYVPQGVKLIHNSNIKENRFEFKENIFLDEDFAIQNNSRRHQIGDIITVHTGDVGTSAIIDEELDGSLGFATIVSRIYDTNTVIPKYVCYYLNSRSNKQNIVSMIKGDRNNLNLKDFNKLTIPVPPVEEQERIVEVLDRFDTLCNDISAGLPAEIEARQKQYEYYRDKLLTFEPAK